MVSWFNPILLVKLLLNVIIADIFGQYADRRLVQAALDDETREQKRERASIVGDLEADDEGAIWFDYVSDSGDGFDSKLNRVSSRTAPPNYRWAGKAVAAGKGTFYGWR
jgi:hypothetical protein